MKKPYSEICVYCGQKATTRDHVPPKQIFPKPRPDSLETVPACFKCNNLLAKDEDYFLATFMFSEAGVSEAGKKLWEQRLHRMYDNNLGLRRKIAQYIKPLDIYSQQGLFVEKRVTIEFDENRLDNVVCKIVKGLYYIEYKKILPTTITLNCLLLRTQEEYDVAQNYVSSLKNGSKTWKGIFQYRFNRTKDDLGSMWILTFYDFATFWVIGHDK
jgi:hypothetical protein